MIRGTQLLQSSTLNDVVSSQDNRRLFACYAEERCGTARIGLSDSPILYWITSNYGVSTLSLDDGGTFRQPILTQHLQATTGIFTYFVLLCVCSVSFVCFSY